ncbi:MAG: helix-turn-helix transcriptional regulator [Candidatus Sedimenticola sp. 6PFRAG7]
MSTKRTAKKQPSRDWHPADIKAALEKAGWSLSKLSLHHGYRSRNTLKNALTRKWPKAERLIAEAIGAQPEAIWPSRYPCSDSVTSGYKNNHHRVSQKGDQIANSPTDVGEIARGGAL